MNVVANQEMSSSNVATMKMTHVNKGDAHSYIGLRVHNYCYGRAHDIVELENFLFNMKK